MNRMKKLWVPLAMYLMISVQVEANQSGICSSPGPEYVAFKDEAMEAYHLTAENCHLSFLNKSLDFGAVGITTGYYDANTNTNHNTIYIDEQGLSKAPAGVKRWVVFHEMAHVLHHDDYDYHPSFHCNDLNTNYCKSRAAYNESIRELVENPYSVSRYVPVIALLGTAVGIYRNMHPAKIVGLIATPYIINKCANPIIKAGLLFSNSALLEHRADEESFTALQCEQCCKECIDLLNSCTFNVARFFRYLSVKEMRILAQQQIGKICKYHANQQSIDVNNIQQ